MANQLDVVAIVGSLRRDSYSRKLMLALSSVTTDAMRVVPVELDQLSVYNQDLDDSPPEAWQSLRARIRAADAVLFVTPEYNRSVPAVLKNVIDIGSRPPGKNVWKGKPSLVVSSSPGALGGFGANHHLRQSLVFLDMPTLAQPEAYFSAVNKLLADNGEFANEGTREFCRTLMAAFEVWIRRHL